MTRLPPLREIFAGRHIVVTGTTGFVGKVWLSHLLSHAPEVGRITLLVRGGKRGARERVAEMVDTSPAFRPLRAQHGDALGPWLDQRLAVWDADLTLPGCGLSKAQVDELTATADAFVHIAGLTDFHPDPRKGVPANIDGTAEIAALAERSRAGRLLHVSTAYVAGMRDGPVPESLEVGRSPLGHRFDIDREITALHEIVRTHPNPQARTDAAAERARELGWPNLYTFTKGLAEHDLGRRDLSLAIVRPSVVECARSWPFVGWNEGLNTSAPIMWFCGTPFPALPSSADHIFDIVPVDAVCRWMTVVLARQLLGDAHRVWQFASGDVNPATFSRIVELTALGKRRHARRTGASPMERLVAQLDVSPRTRDQLGWLTPDRLEDLGKQALSWLEAKPTSERLPGPLASWLGPTVDRVARDGRKDLRDQVRTLGRLRRMLDQYQPFIHDHNWIFATNHIREAVVELHADDQPVYGDTLADLDWRQYWLDVQYPGMVKWAFPLVDGLTVPEDPPSQPPLALAAPTVEPAVAVVA